MTTVCPLEWPLTVRTRGFTLLELLVVLLIIGVVLTFTTLSMDSGRLDGKLEQESRRLLSLIRLVGEEAVMQSQEMGIEFSLEQYRFYVLEEDKWRPLADDVLRERRLPDGIRMDLITDGHQLALAEDLGKGLGEPSQGTDFGTPQVMLLSSGEAIPFQITLTALNHDRAYRISGSWDGKFEMSAESEP